ncbi:MAG: hypothetical protein J6D34_12335 [Atopobiaceae bacterium]|nr:hypothetical protein [Atopobiaceae bacterium]
MRKHVVAALIAALLGILPVPAIAGEPNAVSELCQKASQAQTSDEMVQSIDDAFDAMKEEAEKDKARVEETTPKVMKLDNGMGEVFEFNTCTVERDGKKMRYFINVVGEPDASGYPLYITLHGGGSGTAQTNDNQWYDMNFYYRSSVKKGIYVACRGMEDVWNMHFLPDAYAMYDRIIEDMVLLKNVDPNRVYLLGFSAGGDGVYEITPRMADRFAAANMSSGHPNDVSLLNVANVPFQIQVGVRDYYSSPARRCVRGAEFEKILSGYHDTYGFGYEHRVLVHVPEGHTINDCSMDSPDSLVLKDPTAFASREKNEAWLDMFVDIYSKYYPITFPGIDPDEDDEGIEYDDRLFELQVSLMSYELGGGSGSPVEGRTFKEFNDAMKGQILGTEDYEYGLEAETVDTDAVHYVDRFERSYCPGQLVWDLSTRAPQRSVSSFYWLRADKSVDSGLVAASFDAATNTFTLDPSADVSGDFSVLINPRMVDVSRPVTFATPKGTFTLPVEPDAETVESSLREVTDPYLAWVQEVSYAGLEEAAEPDEPAVATHEYAASGGGTWTIGAGSALSFTIDRVGDSSATNKHFTGISVDGADVAREAYDVLPDTSTGRLVLNLKPAYLTTLSKGTHELIAIFDDGRASAPFSVAAPKSSGKACDPKKSVEPRKAAKQLPKTGDVANALPVALAAVGVGFVAVASRLRKGFKDC